MRYIAFADNLLKGRGLIDYDQYRLLVFPPLFPLVIAGLSFVTRADVFLVGWYLNIILWGINLFLSGVFFRQVFNDTPIYFYLSLFILFLFPSALYMHTSILTEPLFLTCALLLFFAGSEYIQTRSWRMYGVMIVLGIVASLLRWAGMSHIVVAVLVTLWAWRDNLRAALLHAAGLGILSALPVAAWIYFHNYLPTGTLWGISSAGNVFVIENILQAWRKMFFWFVPYRPISPEGKWDAVIFLVFVLLFLLVINHKPAWQAWSRAYRQPLVLTATLFALVSFVSTALMAQTKDHRALLSDRYYALLFPSVLTILFLTFHHLIRPHLRFSVRQINAGLVIVVLLWSALPVNRLVKYIRVSLRDGEAAYNLYNFRKYHQSELIAYARTILEKEPQAILYSNLPAPVWFFTRHLMTYLIPKNEHWSWDDFKQQMAGWPYEKAGYILWFHDDPFRIFYTPSDLYRIAEIYPVYQAADGVIYYVSPRP
ncbi:MAG: hypothetical protein DDG60_06880 [Anaerolineae bacterium]|nr:MAG: hypothetical protein DDG60_06880 [Anaerolineae bacterium]